MKRLRSRISGPAAKLRLVPAVAVTFFALVLPLAAQQTIDITTFTIADLEAAVSEADLPNDWRQTLGRMLEDAHQSYGQYNTERALGLLVSFETYVRAGPPAGFSADVTDALGAEARTMINAIRGGLRLATARVGAAGGTLRVVDPESPLVGAELRIPANALRQTTEVSLSASGALPDNPLLRFPGGGVNVGPDNLALAIPATLVVPYPDADGDGVLDGEDFPVEALNVGTRDRLGRIGFLRSTLDTGNRTQRVQIYGGSDYWNVVWRWNAPQVLTYKFSWPDENGDIAMARTTNLESLRDGVRQAADVWAGMLGEAGIELEEVDASRTAHLRFAFFSSEAARERNASLENARGLLPPLPPGVGESLVQVSALERPEGTGVYFDIAFNATLRESNSRNRGPVWTSEGPGTAGAIPIESAAIHALGHALGLGHSTGSDTLQPGIASAAEALQLPDTCLAIAEVAAFRTLYDRSDAAGLPTCPYASISTSALASDFGTVADAAPRTKQLTLENNGRVTIGIQQIAVEAGRGLFDVDLSRTAMTLQPGDTTTVDVRFQSDSRPGSHTATVRIDSNAADSPVLVYVFATVPDEVPECTLAAEPVEVPPSTPVMLTWTTANFPSEALIDPRPGRVNPSGGQLLVSPQETTEYTLSVANRAGRASCSIRINVLTEPAP